MDLQEIFFKGTIQYLNWYAGVPRNTALDIASHGDYDKPEDIYEMDLTYFLPTEMINKIGSLKTLLPIKPTSFLLGLNLSPLLVDQILKYFGPLNSVIDLIKDNPYELLEVEGLRFRKVDKIALEIFNLPEDFEPRKKALISYHLTNMCQKNGHLFIDIDKFINSRFEAKITIKQVKEYLKELILKKEIVLSGKKLYPKSLYEAESESARIISEIVSDKSHVSFFKDIDKDKFIKGYEEVQTSNIANGTWKKLKWSSSKFELSTKQKEAIKDFIAHKLLVVTGLPGTGKTSVTKALVDMCRSRDLKICLMAPTGIASKRLSKATDFEATTIHKKLHFDGVYWRRNKEGSEDPLAEDVFIIDEFSMVDQVLFYQFLIALPNKEFKVVLVGDDAQLPSVAPGNVLSELVRNNRIPHVHLDKIFRQEEASDIVINSHLINEGKVDLVNKRKDFIFINEDSDDKRLNLIKKIVDSLEGKDYQILTPTYKGGMGVVNINLMLQDHLNPQIDDKIFKTDQYDFRVDDKVMIVKNDYQNMVYNGEQGVIVNINKKSKKLDIYINGTTITYSFYDAYNMITLNYARTVHRTQGQEYDYIVMPWVNDFTIQLQRNLLYTAVTRAKKKVFIIGQKKALVSAIRNNKTSKRNSVFSSRVGTYLANAEDLCENF